MNSPDDDKTLPSITDYLGRSNATRLYPPEANPEATQLHDKTVVRKNSETVEKNFKEKPVLKKRFILEDILGSGGMGVVYKAKDLRRVENHDSDPYVAIKLLNKEFKSHPQAITALQRESKKTQTIAHPNIVSVYDFDRDGQDVFMTMEYMDGKPLDKLIKQYSDGGLPPDDARKILSSVCAALIFAHDNKIIHSDLKPSNIFVNRQRSAKVFDFGIARAVAEAEAEAEHEEYPNLKMEMTDIGESSRLAASSKTIFDAGTLGALTPSYASLEMLRLEPPDIRDDIYALGCVAYEMFTGKHPYRKLPADKAFAQNLKPKPIKSIPKKQWLAIEGALRFKRNERLSSVQEFVSAFRREKKRPIKTLIASAITIASLSIFITYTLLNKPEPKGPSSEEIRDQLAQEITLNLHKKNLRGLMNRPLFTETWQYQLWQEYSAIEKLIPDEATWLKKTRDGILNLHINELESLLQSLQYRPAMRLLSYAYRYTDNNEELDIIKKDLEKLLAKIEKKNDTKPKKIEKTVKLETVPKEPTHQKESFAIAEKNAYQHLICQSSINMRDFSAAISKLKSLDKNRYTAIENDIIKKLSICIKKQAENEPERAIESKRIAMRLFSSNPLIAKIEIARRDPCDISIAGLGARGLNTSCNDIVGNGKNGPRLVVIPSNGQTAAFAISKHEISYGDYSQFCIESGTCKPNTLIPAEQPLTNISFDKTKAYIKWLTRSSGHKYRLPSRKEWVYASKAKNGILDPNRNCTLSSRGINKGDKLVSIRTGRGNSWGIVNSIGNAREWVYDKGRKLVAVGGSYADPIEACNFSTVVKHSGEADALTGFRVVRELAK